MLVFKTLHYSLAQQNAPGSCYTFSFFPPSLSSSFPFCLPPSLSFSLSPFLSSFSLFLTAFLPSVLPPSLSLLSFFLWKPYSFFQESSVMVFFFLVMGMVFRDHILSIASDHCYWIFQWSEAENIFLNVWAYIDISNKNVTTEFLLKLFNFILVSIFNLKFLFCYKINIITYFIMKYIKVSK